MFHKIAITLNCVLLAFSSFVYFSSTVLPLLSNFGTGFIVFVHSQFSLSNVVLYVLFVIFFIVVSFLFIIVASLITDIKVGKPPMGHSVIVYKYGLSDTVTSSAILSDQVHFPHYDKIHICYERKGNQFGIAHGAVISNEVHEDIKEKLAQEGYNIFQAMSASNAMYVSCPMLPWLSYFGIWLILCIVYPRFYKYSKMHRLSAYPVVELYRRFSVVLMAPLSQQDLFLVPEAKSLLNRSCSGVGVSSSISTTSNLSCSPQNHSRSQIFNSVDTTIIDNNNVTKSKLIHSSTPIPSNGSATKQGYED